VDNKTLQHLKKIVGDKWVLTEPGELLVYSFDSALDRATPSLVVLPGNSRQLATVMQILYHAKTPYVARGAATSLCGGPIPLRNGVVIALARLKEMGKTVKGHNEITVEPGVVNQRLQEAVAPENLFYAPDPGSQKACTIGGNVATNAGGPHCLKYGVTSNHVMALDWILPDGAALRMNVRDPGYDLIGLFVGSEGTLGVASRITLKLLPIPKFIRTLVVSFKSMEEAIQAVTDIIAAGILPATLEAMDKTVVEAVEAFVQAGYPLEADGVLLIEVDGKDSQKLEEEVGKIKDICEKNKCFDVKVAKDEEERQKLWEGRRGSYAAMARLAPNVLVEDGAVPRTRLPEVLKKIKEIAKEAGLNVALLFHAGDGNLHPQIIFDERDKEHTRIVKEAGFKMLKACVDLGGTISGEHGIGIDKREAMKWLFSRETLSLFRRIKLEFDANNVCNPDKLIPLVGKLVVKEEEDDKWGEFHQLAVPEPKDETELVNYIKSWAKTRQHFSVNGTKSKFVLSEATILLMHKINQVLDFDKGNLTLTVQAGAKISEVRSLVEKENQYLWVAGEGTVGGVVATCASAAPPLRDQILGMRVLLPSGDIVKFGAKTMKNVAGYDAAKLLIGSWGTLGIIIDVTFRLFPYPAEKLEARPVRPFVMKNIHKRIKKAFDPDSILSNRLTLMKQEDIDKAVKAPVSHGSQRAEEEDVVKKLKDKFWSE